MSLALQIRSIPLVWRVAVLGTLAALPAAVVINWVPNSQADAGGSIMIVGALIAGGLAVTRSVDPSAAGLRTGFLGGGIELLISAPTVFAYLTGSPHRIVFVIFAGGFLLGGMTVFGWIFGLLGGWITNTVAARWTRSTTDLQ